MPTSIAAPLVAIALALLTATPSAAQTYGEQPLYPGRANYGALAFRQPSAWYSYLMLAQHRRDAEREAAISRALTSKKQALAYQAAVRERFNALFGARHERTPLNARCTGTVRSDGFRVEKIVFQSLPGRYVTAHLYIPDEAKKPMAACVEMCGHGLNGKGNGSHTALAMVRTGIAVLVVDPIAQGERLQLTDRDGKPVTRGVTTEHTLLNTAYNLIGTSLAAEICFDNSRAIDYLCSRPDIDASRIGAYGFSGGGTETAYLMAYDRRVAAAAVGLFFSRRTRTHELQGPSDGCQQMPGEGGAGIEIADMAIAAAPTPLLVLDGRYDFVDHWGALTATAETRRVYEAMGYSGRVSEYYAEDGHATPPDVVNELTAWFRKWLRVPPTATVRPTDGWHGDTMLCTAKGQVNLEYPDARSTMQECLAVMDSLAPQRREFMRQDTLTQRQTLLALLGLTALPDSVEAVATGRSHLREAEEYRFQLNSPGQMPVAVVARVPSTATPQSAVELHLTERGKAWYLDDLGRRDDVSDGAIIIAADFRGIGELEDPYIYNYTKYWNRDWRSSALAHHLGKPLIGQRCCDLATLLRFVATWPQTKGRAINIVADGVYGPVVEHGAALGLTFSKAVLTRCPKTWRDYIANPLQRDMYANIVIGALRYYDLPDLVTLSRGRIRVND